MDPIQMRELYERQFWAGVAQDAKHIEAMVTGAAPVHPDFQERTDRRYRVTFTCKSCPDEHTVTGTWKQAINAMMVLTARGIDELLIQEEAHAINEDAQVADEAIEERGLDPNINAMLNEQFFTRKP